MFTKEQLAKWREQGFLFDNFYDQVAIEKKKEDDDGAYLSVSGYWSSDAKGEKKISKARLEDRVYYIVELGQYPVNVDTVKVKLKLLDNDFPLYPDEKFPNSNNEKKAIIKNIIFRNSNKKLSFPLDLDAAWKSMISDDVGREIELYWEAQIDKTKFDLNAILNVGYSRRKLFFKPPLKGYNLPELLAADGDTIIFGIGAVDEMTGGEAIDNARIFLATRRLKAGFVATNTHQIYQKKKAIYSYIVYNNEGSQQFEIKKGSNFGFVKDGKVVTTKGISQLDYFANYGIGNSILKFGKEVLTIFDVMDLVSYISGDRPETLPLPTPLGFVTQLISSNFKKEFDDELREQAWLDFEIAKQRGLKETQSFLNGGMRPFLNLRSLWIKTKTLNKLLKGGFLNYLELNAFNDGDDGEHYLIYRYLLDEETSIENCIIETIFISDNLLK